MGFQEKQTHKMFSFILLNIENLQCYHKPVKVHHVPASESASTRSPMVSLRRFVWAPKM